MVAAIMRALLACAALFALTACESLGEKEPTFLGAEATSLPAQTVPGISDLDTITKQDKADEKWWDNYYGNK